MDGELVGGKLTIVGTGDGIDVIVGKVVGTREGTTDGILLMEGVDVVGVIVGSKLIVGRRLGCKLGCEVGRSVGSCVG